jgi:hypothetical protein
VAAVSDAPRDGSSPAALVKKAGLLPFYCLLVYKISFAKRLSDIRTRWPVNGPCIANAYLYREILAK